MTPAAQLQLVVTPLSLEQQLHKAWAALDAERTAHLVTKQDLALATAATKNAWQAFAVFEREILRAYRRAKKRSGYTPKPRKPKAVAA